MSLRDIYLNFYGSVRNYLFFSHCHGVKTGSLYKTEAKESQTYKANIPNIYTSVLKSKSGEACTAHFQTNSITASCFLTIKWKVSQERQSICRNKIYDQKLLHDHGSTMRLPCTSRGK